MPKAPAVSRFSLAIECYREVDGRWLADIPALPGVTAYRRTKKQATAAVQALALRLIADRWSTGRPSPAPWTCLSVP
jgi:predicted RNase H-like HicB family nuclease